MMLDILFSHNDAVKETVGNFYGLPIRRMSVRELDVNRQTMTLELIEAKLEGLQAEILPGEVVSEEDMVIRRATTAEAIGPAFYEYTAPADALRTSLAEARVASKVGAMVSWRPDGKTGRDEEFALVHQEEEGQ